MNPSRKPANIAASVRARLENLSRELKVEFQLLLSEFAIERWLFRLGVSRYAEDFVLKGAMLFKLWSDERHRATWDLDLRGLGPGGVAQVVAVVREVSAIREEDGIAFELDSIDGEEIRSADEYAGVRVRFAARLAEARIPMQIDVGFADAIVPSAVPSTYPTLLGHGAPKILAYPREAVVAEKLEAMISLGVTNSRMKDFYDVFVLASTFTFQGRTLAHAIRSTFERRGTAFPVEEPLVLKREFLAAPERQTQWRAFLRRSRLGVLPDAEELADALARFLISPLTAAARDEDFLAVWPAGGPWSKS